MKRFLAALTAAALSAVMLTACNSKDKQEENKPQQDGNTVTASEQVKTGLYTAAIFEGSTAASSEAEGSAKLQVALIALTVDDGGRIDDLDIELLGSSAGFDTAGQLTAPPQDLLSMLLPDQNGVQNANALTLNAFEEYCRGKTLQELKDAPFDPAKVSMSTDLAGTATVEIERYADYLQTAANRAQQLGAMKGDRVSLAVRSDLSGSQGVQGNDNGAMRAGIAMAAVTTAKDGKITSCIVDELEAELTFGADGSLVGDPGERPQTKNELGEEYGLKAQSPIGKEWYEQAAALAQYVTGKTADEVMGIALTDEGRADQADLKSSVTIKIADYIDLIAEAARRGTASDSGDGADLPMQNGEQNSTDSNSAAQGQENASASDSADQSGKDAKQQTNH